MFEEIGTNQYRNRMRLSAKGKISLLIMALFIAVIIIWGRERVYAWENAVIAPCPDKCADAIVTPEVSHAPLTHDEIILASNHPKEIMKIWVNESSKGKNDVEGGLQKYCEGKGMTNEFGYGGMQSKFCYKTFQDAVNVVDKWLDTQTAVTLCYYNLGIKTDKCGY